MTMEGGALVQYHSDEIAKQERISDLVPQPQRHENWRTALNEYILSVRDTPFQYGTHDCILFMAGAVYAQTAIDLAAPYRGKYDNLYGGIKLMQRLGYGGPLQLLQRFFKEIPVSYAHPGDLALVNIEGERLPAGGVFQGEMVYVLGPTGVTLMPMLMATRAFRVEF